MQLSNLPTRKKTSSISLYAIDIFALFLVVGLAMGGAYTLIQNMPLNDADEIPKVLGDEDEQEYEEDEIEPTEVPEATEVEEADSEGDEDESEDSSTDSSSSNSQDEDYSDENDAGDKDNITTETVTGADGTVTTTMTKTEDDGSTKTIQKTIDAAGNVSTRVVETKGNDQVEVSVKTTMPDGTEYEYKKEDGGSVKLEVKGSEDGQESKVEYDSGSDEFNVEVEEGDIHKLMIKYDNDMFMLSRLGVEATTDLPISVDEKTGEVTVTATEGDVVIKTMPDDIADDAEVEQKLDEIESVELGEDQNGDLEYVVKGKKIENLLGVFPIDLKQELSYDPVTGDLVEISQTFFSRVLDFFSF